MSLTTPPPTSSSPKARQAFARSFVKTPVWSPKALSFTWRIASPKSVNPKTTTSGADADLARVGERPHEDPLHGPVDVRGPVHDHRGVAAELQDDLLLAGPLLHAPADGRAAGKRQDLEANVGHH